MPDPLPEPSTEAGREALALLLREPGRALVACDFDGTLAPIVARPEDARAAAGAVDAVQRLAARVGRMAVVTGRPAAEVVRLGRLDAVEGLHVHGHYGLQHWSAGVLDGPPEHPGIEELRGPLAELVAAAPEGVALEDKGHALAVHTRRAADPSGTLAALREPLLELARSAGLAGEPGRHVLELRPPGTDKGGVLEALAEELGARVVLFAGDDRGDLAAAAAVARLRQRGTRGLVVLVDSPEAPPELRDVADVVVEGPTAFVALLASLADRLGGVR